MRADEQGEDALDLDGGLDELTAWTASKGLDIEKLIALGFVQAPKMPYPHVYPLTPKGHLYMHVRVVNGTAQTFIDKYSEDRLLQAIEAGQTAQPSINEGQTNELKDRPFKVVPFAIILIVVVFVLAELAKLNQEHDGAGAVYIFYAIFGFIAWKLLGFLFKNGSANFFAQLVKVAKAIGVIVAFLFVCVLFTKIVGYGGSSNSGFCAYRVGCTNE